MNFNSNSVRKLAITGSLILSFAAFGAAQTTSSASPSPTGTTAAQGDSGKKGLDLTADQKTQIKKIHQDEKQQIQAVKADSSLTKEQKKAKIKDIRTGGESQIKGLLTPEQQQKWAQRKARHRAHRHGRHVRKNSFR